MWFWRGSQSVNIIIIIIIIIIFRSSWFLAYVIFTLELWQTFKKYKVDRCRIVCRQDNVNFNKKKPITRIV